GCEVQARYVFNVTYSEINRVLSMAGLPEAALKHEETEIALVRPPEELAGYGITVMDGPFFSTMPYPSKKLYSLTHVRYTPHASWTNRNPAARLACETNPHKSHVRHMILDSSRYVPCLSKATWEYSLYEIKTILIKNEGDDGRPILFQRRPATSRVISVLGAKIDNIYDLFTALPGLDPALVAADDRFFVERGT